MNAVPLNTTTLNTRLLNTTRLNTNGFPMLSKRGGSSADISQAIMDSLVCWYDPGKQQCTNESMAANPVLADLSGNGHDITCYNFAWSGVSGIGGGYFYDESNYEASSNYGTIKGNIIKITKWAKGVSAFHSRYVYGEKGKPLQLSIPAITIKVSGLPDGYNLDVSYIENRGNGIEYFSIKRDIVNGFTTLEAREINIEPYSENSTCYFRDMKFAMDGGKGTVSAPEDVDITIEILPLYPNALVSDGVDDYCYTDGMPILTDYTVIAKRKWLQTEDSNNDCFAAKGNNLASFLIERYGNNGSQECYSFGQYNGVSFVQEDVIYQTKESYNGYPLKVGTATDVDNLVILGRTSAHLGCIQAALYSFLLFDRTLTTAEIEWVKKNMIESGGVLATDWSDSSLWAFYNEANQYRITGTLSSNRMTINSSGMTNPHTQATAKFMEVIVQNLIIPAYKIKVTGLRNGIVLTYADDLINVKMSEDGIYNIPEHDAQNLYFGFSFNKAFKNENIVIQQLLSE